jgi:hypothetical protein
MADLTRLDPDDLVWALRLWDLGCYSTADIAEMISQPEAAVANSIGKFRRFTQGRAA